ncbi:hypothetical protein PRZ48_011936 [Zasmidium cellare]|uniref:mRNA 3'-end-processing protein RNA14 n=1 Tax=Zasmidium cellare TaxID=395010 RepID=A0ABR0E8C1_ZASCE|nr:hypothetical protein PRZ48_011936 [Zasmidium cellare]
MADEYDPLDPPTFDAAAEDEEAYDPTEYETYDQQDAGDEDEDYDPSSFNFGGDSSEQQPPTAAQDSPAPVEKAPKPQQKVAGFIVEESDDEQDESAPPPSQLNGADGAHSGLGAVAASEAQDVSLSSAPQDTATLSTSLNGSTTVHVPASTSPSLPDPSVQQPLPDQGKTISPAASAQASVAPTPQPPAVAAAPGPSTAQTNGATSQPPARLPHDKVGQLEDRIRDDPKGDIEAWMTLVEHYTDKGQYDQVRVVYDRFLSVFRKSAPLWRKRILMERELDERDKVVSLLSACVTTVPSVDLFKIYLDHVRRVMPLLNDDGNNLATIDQAFSLAFDHIGTDPDAGIIYHDYIEFLQETPGNVGGSSVKDGQKVDRLRAAYQRAIRVPHSESVKLWKEYEAFEMGLHKATGRKHIQEQSPFYVESRKAKVQLDQKMEGLDRQSLPRLPPIYGCAGEEEFGTQVEKWRAWIAWERDEDPLVLKGSEDAIWRQRVLYAYKQATMSLYFYPDIWFEAASWCFAQGDVGSLSQEGEKFLEEGILANPESVLLAMMKADRIESTLDSGNTDEILLRNGGKLDVPYEAVHTALYSLRNKMVEKDKKTVAQIHEYFASLPAEDDVMQTQADDDDEAGSEQRPQTRDEQKKAQIDAVKAASAGQLDKLKRTISYVWVAKMRAFRRVQGQGQPQKKGGPPVVKGLRGVFSDARSRGFISSDVYIASALIEWNSYRDSSAGKIFDRGLKLFPTDEIFILEYVKHLVSEGDITNGRVVFESTISKITNSAEFTQEQKRDKCRDLFVFMHDYESKYGDLAQIHRLEKRMAEMYPEEPDVNRFSNRFSLPTFDAMHAQLLLSPTQALPKTELPVVAAPPPQAMASIEQRLSPKAPEILLGPNGPYVASPKRPLEDSDTDTPQRKFMRAESPLKGAAGVRMQGKATTTGGGSGGFATKTFVPANVAAAQAPPPTPLPPIIEWFLRILPNAAAYNGVRFDPAKLVQFMPTVNPQNARR